MRRKDPVVEAARKALNPDTVYECHEAHCVTLPGAAEPTVIKRGARLRGDHAAVQYNPGLFLADGYDETELAAARLEAYPGGYGSS